STQSPFDGPPGIASIRQLDKANGNLVRTLTSGSIPALAAGIPDDPTTFCGQFKDALWAKETISSSLGNTLLAFEIPGGTLGQGAGAPLACPAACDQLTGATPDTDGDGLLDGWETGSPAGRRRRCPAWRRSAGHTRPGRPA